MYYLLSGLFRTHPFPSSSWSINCQEHYWFSKRWEIRKKAMFSRMYFPPVDHCWRFAFQRQVKDVGNETGYGIPDQDLMETPPGHPVFGTCLLPAGTRDTLRGLLLLNKSHNMYVVPTIKRGVLHSKGWLFLGESNNSSPCKRLLCKPAFTRRNRRNQKVKMLGLLAWFCSLSQRSRRGLRSPN